MSAPDRVWISSSSADQIFGGIVSTTPQPRECFGYVHYEYIRADLYNTAISERDEAEAERDAARRERDQATAAADWARGRANDLIAERDAALRIIAEAPHATYCEAHQDAFGEDGKSIPHPVCHCWKSKAERKQQ